MLRDKGVPDEINSYGYGCDSTFLTSRHRPSKGSVIASAVRQSMLVYLWCLWIAASLKLLAMTDVAVKRFRHCKCSAEIHARITVVRVDCRVAEAPRNDGSGRQMLS